MTGYTRSWDCRVCGERQESVCYPKVEVCERCLEPLAKTLCRETLGVAIDAAGVDRGYWVRKADGYAERLFSRRRRT